jgi:hypothetical protein
VYRLPPLVIRRSPAFANNDYESKLNVQFLVGLHLGASISFFPKAVSFIEERAVQHRSAVGLHYALLGEIPGRAMKSLILCGLVLSASFAAGQMSHTCKFTRGPLQGQTHTFPNRTATAIGSGCSDGLTSSGITVRDPEPKPERTSHTCKFTRGPLQGQSHSLPNREATPVGSTCSDGLTSSGIAVPDPDTPERSERLSHTCKFRRGPLQGQTQTLPYRSPTAVGSTCSDGLTSTGVTVPDPS